MATREMNEPPTCHHPETFLSHCARLHLAGELGVQADELEYCGVQEGLGYFLVMFTVDLPGSDLHRSTRSVRVDL
jgi:hypothetical protein